MLIAIFLVGVPVHLVRMSQLSIDCELPGRGVLLLTVVEQRVYLMSGIGILLQICLLLETPRFGYWGCKAFSMFMAIASTSGTLCGAAISMCR